MKIRLERWLKIYSDGNHNAFTSVCWYRDKPYCTFRHASNHISEDGRVLVLRGTETAARWMVVGCIRGASDTRDPKLMPTPHGLFSYSFLSQPDPATGQRSIASGYSFSEDGEHWSPWTKVEADMVYWAPRWHKGRGYVAAYRSGDFSVTLKTTADGQCWEDVCLLVQDEETWPNEVSMDFAEDDRCWALIRREHGQGFPLLATAEPPYTDWSFTELPIKLQGPCLWLVEEEVWISGRWYQPSGYVNTAIFRMDGATPVPQIVLPSGGDTSYMGAAQHPQQPERWWLTYYSSHAHNPRVNSHEHPADIYLCDVVFTE